MELVLNLVNRNYLPSCIIMLAVGGLLLLFAALTKKDILFILCILWSVLAAVITGNITVSGMNFEKSFILLGFVAAHVCMIIAVFAIRLSNKTHKNTKLWAKAGRILIVSIGVLFAVFLVYRAFRAL